MQPIRQCYPRETFDIHYPLILHVLETCYNHIWMVLFAYFTRLAKSQYEDLRLASKYMWLHITFIHDGCTILRAVVVPPLISFPLRRGQMFVFFQRYNFELPHPQFFCWCRGPHRRVCIVVQHLSTYISSSSLLIFICLCTTDRLFHLDLPRRKFHLSCSKMNGLYLLLLLCNLAHSSRIIMPKPQSQLQSASSGPSSSSPVTCLHGQSSEFSVTAYPGSSCAADVLNLIELLPKTPYPLSCPSSPRNTKCFPITEKISTAPSPAKAPSRWEDLSEQSALWEWQKLELRSRKSPSSRRQRSLSSPSPTTESYKARSVSLIWPDEMTHAVFYVDDGCEYVDDWRQGEVSHVERGKGVGEQCVAIGEQGLWGSVEFMREQEWKEWSAIADRA